MNNFAHLDSWAQTAVASLGYKLVRNLLGMKGQMFSSAPLGSPEMHTSAWVMHCEMLQQAFLYSQCTSVIVWMYGISCYLLTSINI